MKPSLWSKLKRRKVKDFKTLSGISVTKLNTWLGNEKWMKEIKLFASITSKERKLKWNCQERKPSLQSKRKSMVIDWLLRTWKLILIIDLIREIKKLRSSSIRSLPLLIKCIRRRTRLLKLSPRWSKRIEILGIKLIRKSLMHSNVREMKKNLSTRESRNSSDRSVSLRKFQLSGPKVSTLQRLAATVFLRRCQSLS